LYQSKGKVKLVQPLDPRRKKMHRSDWPCSQKAATDTIEYKKRNAENKKRWRDKNKKKLAEDARNKYYEKMRKLGKTVIQNKTTDKNRKKIKQWYVQRRHGKQTGPGIEKKKKAKPKNAANKKKQAVKRKQKVNEVVSP